MANPSFGMELNGGAPPPLGNNTRITTTNTINAATISGNATTSGYVEFYMMTANLSGAMGWDVQTSTDGATWTTRVSELTGNNHTYPATPYHYDLTAAERVSTLQLRFRFAGTGPTGTPTSRFSLDDIKVVASTGSSPATIAMSGPSAGGIWTATIPAQVAGTVVNYNITATDSAAATATNTGTYTVSTAAPVLAVTPSTTLSSAGAAGSGIFSPASLAYTLTNSGTGTMSWTASKTQPWLNLSSTSGSLAAGASTTVTVSINAANANSLAANTYNDTITFTNSTNGSGNTTRSASLLVTNGNPTVPAAPVVATLPLFSAGTGKTITWPAVATATSYTLQIASSANFTTNLLASQTVTTPYAIFSNLADGVTYYYRVLATNNIGSSPYNNTVSTTQDTGAPAVAITSPSTTTTTATNTIIVTGTASDTRSGISGVKVNNVVATSTSGNFATWTATIPLGFGGNTITAIATDGAGNQTTTPAPPTTPALTVTMTTPQTYNPLIIPGSIVGTTFNLDLYQTNKRFPTWSATNPVLGINPSTTLGPAPGTTTLGYNGMQMWGPTLIMNKGDAVQLNVTNHLDQSSSTLLRSTTTTVHWHGFHIPAIMDGGPRQVVAAGTTWSPTFEVKNDAATYWYHPHLHMATQEQLTLGAGGMIIVRDPAEAALNLPRTYGVDDIPLAVTTRRLLSGNNEFSANQYVQADGSTSSRDNYGDYVLVNGTMNPQVSLPQQFVRLRILCADIQRGYRFGFSDNRNFYVIANDQGLLNTPQLVSQVTMMIGERVEILVSLSNDAIGSSLDLISYDNLGAAGGLAGSLGGFGGSESPSTAPDGNVGRENGGLLCNSDFKVLHINVAAPTANPITSAPATLANNTYWTNADATTTRTINIANGNGGTPGFTFDGIAYSPTTNNFNIPLNAIEKWTFNGGQVFGHSIHIHDIKFKIVGRSVTQSGVNTNQIFDTVNGSATLIGSKACANYESGWKDTLYVPRGESVSVIAKYDDFASPNNPYMLHCHMLNHEDGGLMGQFVVTSAATETLAIASFARTGNNNLIDFQFNATNGTSYLVQYSPDMTTGSWVTIGTVTSDGTAATFTEADAARLAQPRGFYRAVIQSVVTPPVVTSSATATATRGAAFSYQITATNSPTGYGAILLSGNTATGLPGGLTVNPATGVVSGIVPAGTAAGSYNISVSASNSGGTTHKTVVLTVN
ncbi:MAG: multicopper oxidase domain-containing protein [Chthoniobacteraceae bacterium]